MKRIKAAAGAKRYEGSATDNRKDRAAAKRMGITDKAYERTAADKREDNAAQRKLNARVKGK